MTLSTGQVDERAGMSISIMSPSSTRPISAAFGRFGRDVADGQARGAAREAAVGDQGAGLAQPLGFQVAGRIEHLLHAGAAARALVADQHHVAGLDLAGQDALTANPGFQRCAPGPVNFRIDSSTPAVLTMQPSSARLPNSTARPPSWRRHARRLSGSRRLCGRCRVPCSGGTGEKAVCVGTPPGAGR
jgi:hypothetical protein